MVKRTRRKQSHKMIGGLVPFEMLNKECNNNPNILACTSNFLQKNDKYVYNILQRELPGPENMGKRGQTYKKAGENNYQWVAFTSDPKSFIKENLQETRASPQNPNIPQRPLLQGPLIAAQGRPIVAPRPQVAPRPPIVEQGPPIAATPPIYSVPQKPKPQSVAPPLLPSRAALLQPSASPVPVAPPRRIKVQPFAGKITDETSYIPPYTPPSELQIPARPIFGGLRKANLILNYDIQMIEVTENVTDENTKQTTEITKMKPIMRMDKPFKFENQKLLYFVLNVFRAIFYNDESLFGIPSLSQTQESINRLSGQEYFQNFYAQNKVLKDTLINFVKTRSIVIKEVFARVTEDYRSALNNFFLFRFQNGVSTDGADQSDSKLCPVENYNGLCTMSNSLGEEIVRKDMTKTKRPVIHYDETIKEKLQSMVSKEHASFMMLIQDVYEQLNTNFIVRDDAKDIPRKSVIESFQSQINILNQMSLPQSEAATKVPHTTQDVYDFIFETDILIEAIQQQITNRSKTVPILINMHNIMKQMFEKILTVPFHTQIIRYTKHIVTNMYKDSYLFFFNDNSPPDATTNLVSHCKQRRNTQCKDTELCGTNSQKFTLEDNDKTIIKSAIFLLIQEYLTIGTRTELIKFGKLYQPGTLAMFLEDSDERLLQNETLKSVHTTLLKLEQDLQRQLDLFFQKFVVLENGQEKLIESPRDLYNVLHNLSETTKIGNRLFFSDNTIDTLCNINPALLPPKQFWHALNYPCVSSQEDILDQLLEEGSTSLAGGTRRRLTRRRLTRRRRRTRRRVTRHSRRYARAF